MICPKCKNKQENIVECESCGIVFERCYKLILKKKLNEGIALYREGDYKEALEIFKYIQKTNKYNDTELSANSADYIVKIQEKVEEESRETRLVPREKIEKYSIDKKEIEEIKDNFSTAGPTNQEQQRTFTPYAIYGAIILLIISSCYLHYEYHYKLRKVSEILSASTQDSMSELSKTTQQSFGIIAKQVDVNTNKISSIEYTVKQMIPILKNCNENSHTDNFPSDISR